MYVGVVTVILGWTALFQAYSLVLYALAAGAVFHLASSHPRPFKLLKMKG